MTFTAADSDARFMALALQLAARGLCSTKPNPRVGCVIVQGETIVGTGYHHHAGGPHAEILALAAAGHAAAGGTAYVTLEPCSHHGRTPPCVDALIAAGLARVVYAVGDPYPQVAGRGVARLLAAGIEVQSGVLDVAARELNRGFLSRCARGRPFTTLKVGMSLDGKIALANGESQWITGPAARADVQRLRARSCVVLTGIGTVRADDPALTVRDPGFDLGGTAPRRAVLDRELQISDKARLFDDPGSLIIFTASDDRKRIDELITIGAAVERTPTTRHGVDLAAVLARLGELSCNEVLVECGPRLAGSLLDAQLVDELVAYIAPSLLGGDARSAFAIAAPPTLSARLWLEPVDTTWMDRDLRLTMRPASA